MQTQTAKRGKIDMLPPMPRGRQKGGRGLMAFRPPQALADYLAEVKRLGFDKTAALLDLAEPMLEIRQALGPEWHDLLKASELAHESIGATITRFVRVGLKKR